MEMKPMTTCPHCDKELPIVKRMFADRSPSKCPHCQGKYRRAWTPGFVAETIVGAVVGLLFFYYLLKWIFWGGDLGFLVPLFAYCALKIAYDFLTVNHVKLEKHEGCGATTSSIC